MTTKPISPCASILSYAVKPIFATYDIHFSTYPLDCVKLRQSHTFTKTNTQ